MKIQCLRKVTPHHIKTVYGDMEMSRVHLVKMQAKGMVENHSMIDCTLAGQSDLPSLRETMGLMRMGWP